VDESVHRSCTRAIALAEKAFAFVLGCIATPHALETLHPNYVRSAVARHASGDWGDPCEDLAANQYALDEGLRLLSSYQDRTGVKYWIITEADRSATTVLLPEDY
jgi:hypothetical protein